MSRIARITFGWLAALSLLTACSSSPVEQLRDCSSTFAGVECIVRSEDGERWCILRTVNGQELTAVAFDYRLGFEDYDSQRFFGYDLDELEDLEGEGNPDLVRSTEARIASCLWVVGMSDFDGTDVEADVANRQSQLLSSLVGVLAPPDDPGNSEVTRRVWASDGCSYAPDFDFAICCWDHDACYEVGGDSGDREDCDEDLGNCIQEFGRPGLAAVYEAAVRAFGWISFNHR
jgi:hypothetical protein